jgi:hypothetical protein
MPINLDQTGPAHLLSTDEDGLILNGSPVISKSIHVSDIEPKTYFGDTNTKLLWLDTGTTGVSSFPNGGAANWILRTNGNGTVSWTPPSALDATKFHYRTSTSIFETDPGSGSVRFTSRSGATMSTASKLVISGYTIAGDPNYVVGATPAVPSYNLISSFINSLSSYGNSNRRGFIKIEKENDPNHFQIYEFSNITDNTGWFEIDVSAVRVESGDENFPDGEPVSITFTVAGPEAVTQDLSSYITTSSTQTLLLKTLTKPFIQEPVLTQASFTLTGVSIGANGVIDCDPKVLVNVSIEANGSFQCTADTFAINDAVYISGTLTGSGSITGYTTGTTYYIIATNGTTEFTVSDTLGGSAITTSTGTSTGLTFTKVVFAVNDVVKVKGANGGTGVIDNYDANGSLYFIVATNGRDQFTLSEVIAGTAVTTTAGTVTGAMIFTSNVGTSITFDDGFVENGFETKLSVLENTADRKIILPDADTTLVGIDNTQTLSNKTIIAPSITDPDINLTYSGGNASTNITISSDLATDFNTRIGTTATNQYSWTTNLYYDGTAWQKDDATRGAWRLNQVTLDADNTSEIAITYAPVGSVSVQDHLKIDGLGVVRLPIDVPSTDTTTGTLVVEGGVGIGGTVNIGGDTNITGALDAGSIQATPIGTVSRSSGAFTTLAANGLFEVTDNTVSTSQTTGAAVISGGLGVGGAAYINGPIFVNDLEPGEEELLGYSLVIQSPQAKVRIGPNYTAGAVDYIDILPLQDNPTITTTSDNFTFENAQVGGNITLTATDAAVIVAENTAATDKTSGALQVVGGIGVSLDIHADDIYVYGQTGLANTASQVVSLAATQTLTNKTLEAAVLNDNVLTGTLEADGSTGIAGQLLSSTGTGVEWVNPVTNSAVIFYKASDQNFNNSPGVVALPASAAITIGSDFGDMNAGGSGVFTFSVTGTYQIIINYSITDINGGAVYPAVDFWVRKNGVDTVKYCQVLTDGSRRGAVTEYIEFAANDTMSWYINSTLRVNGGSPSVTGSRLTIVRVQ